MQKFTLTISPDYVKDWNESDGIREFIQNWIDQKKLDKTSGSYIKASNGVIIIENNNSILERQTLLMGGGTKSNDEKAIGGFGEGYKVALLVLTRLGFKVHIANYGLGELWEPEISHSHEYNTEVLKISCKPLKHGKNIKKGVSVIITKQDFNFNTVLEKIYLKHRENSVIAEHKSYGQILDPNKEKGNIYIGGLFISNAKNLHYGYNFNPGIIEIGRDRSIADTFYVKYHGQKIFKNLKDEYIDDFNENLEKKISDFEHLEKYSIPEKSKEKLKEKYSDKQVISHESDKQIFEEHGIKVKNPAVVHSAVKNFLWDEYSDNNTSVKKMKKKTTKELLAEFLESEKDNLTTEQNEKLNYILKRN